MADRSRAVRLDVALLPAFITALWARNGWTHVRPADQALPTPAVAGPSELWSMWPLEPWIALPLIAVAILYVRGARRGGAGRRPVHGWEIAAFACGWLALVVALASPLHPLGEILFSAHMAQHEVLMLVAAPLLVLGRPHVTVLRALPLGLTRAAARRSKPLWPVAALVASPLVAWAIHAVILWSWHVPRLFQAALRSDVVHAVQHATFLGSALLFWWALLEHGTHRAPGYGAAILFVFTTALHSGLLGVLLTFSGSVWYPAYAGRTEAWGLSALEDQQLGGVIMWAPACAVYTVGGIALLLAWLRASAEAAGLAPVTGGPVRKPE